MDSFQKGLGNHNIGMFKRGVLGPFAYNAE